MIQQDIMEQIIRSQQEQIAGLLEANRSLVESNGRLLEQTDALQQKIQELLSQIAWLNRQLFGRRSEKLAVLDPNQLSLFNPVPATGQNEDIREEDSSAAAPSKAKPDGKKKESRRNRELLEGLPVIEVVIEPDRVDLDRYRRIGEERTRTLEFEPGRLYVKETVRPKYGLKDNLSLPKEGESGVIIAPLPPFSCLQMSGRFHHAGRNAPAEIRISRSILQAGQGVPPSGCPSFRKHTERLVQACV